MEKLYDMKRVLFLCLCLVSAMQAFAQINMKDSTAQVVAYWNKGDKYTYDYVSQRAQIKGSDTTITGYTESRFELEVTDSTANGYLISYTKLSESAGIDENSPMAGLMKQFQELTKSLPIILKTDETGAIQEIVNFEEYKNQAVSQITMFTDVLRKDKEWKKLGPEADAALNSIVAMFTSDQYILKLIEPITTMFTYHGCELKMNNSYTSTAQIDSPYIAGMKIDAENNTYIAECNPETSWTTINNTTVYNKEQLKVQMFDQVNALMPQDAKMKSVADMPDVSIEGSSSVTVHLNTGWPGYATLLQETRSADSVKIQRWAINIVL